MRSANRRRRTRSSDGRGRRTRAPTGPRPAYGTPDQYVELWRDCATRAPEVRYLVVLEARAGRACRARAGIQLRTARPAIPRPRREPCQRPSGVCGSIVSRTATHATARARARERRRLVHDRSSAAGSAKIRSSEMLSMPPRARLHRRADRVRRRACDASISAPRHRTIARRSTGD